MRRATESKGAVSFARLAVTVIAALAALSGCGGGAKDTPDGRIRGNTLTIYASVPLRGLSRVSGTLA